MKYLLIPFIALGLGSAAYAASDATSYPPCSKSVKDECTGGAPAMHAKAHSTTHKAHAANHHSTKAKTETSAKS